MVFLKWICFLIVCTDVIGYIIGISRDIGNCFSSSSRTAKIIGMFIGVAARVFVLYGAATYWLLI
jgi:hypothetical protein